MIDIPKRETLQIEFKSDKKKLPEDAIIDSVVAFANTEGGELYIGVEDDGTPSGLHRDHANVLALSALIANKTAPSVGVRVSIVHDTPPVVRVEVAKSRAIIATSTGRILRRRLKHDGSPENIPLYPYEIPSRLSSLRMLDYSAQPIPDASYADLDPLERLRLRNSILANQAEPLLQDLSDEELDRALRLVTDSNGAPVPTVTGMLLLGKPSSLQHFLPTHAAAFQVLSGTEVKVNDAFHLPLLAAIEKLYDYMGVWNQETEIEVGFLRVSIPDYDKRAFREALVNAFSHRDYAMLGQVRLQLDETGLTLSNPGGFIEGVTLHNLLSVEPQGRNPALADALKRIGLAERTGRGVDRIYEGSLRFGRALPDYSASTMTMVSLYLARSAPDISFVDMISRAQQQQGNPFSIYALFVLHALREYKRVSLSELTQLTGLQENRVKAILEHLVETGLVEAFGEGRGRRYRLSSNVYRQKAKSAAYVRQSGIDSVLYPELVLKLAGQQPFIVRNDVMELLHVSAQQAYIILGKLVETGQLIARGEKRGRKYYLP